MPKKFLSAIVLLAVTASVALQAQTYSNAVMSLNPVGYWPLGEATAPPQPINISANNLGSLGAAGNGFYGAWYQPSGNTWYLTNNIVQTTGVTTDGDKAMNCQYAPGQYVILPRNTNGVANGAITITAPFTIETWIKVGTTIGRLGDIVSEGQVQLNSGGPNTNNPFYGGSGGPVWAGFELGQYANFFFFNVYNTNAYNNKANELDSPANLTVGQWVHLVVTFDGTTKQMYENGVLVGTKPAAANAAGLTYVPDPTSPLMIGSGGVPSITYGNPFQGALDEVAIYPEVLPQSSIVAHYQTAGGTNSTYGANYVNAVLADNPMIYFRMNDSVSQAGAGYPSGTFPVANNYGSIGTSANGVYQPGTTPGVAGPTYSGFGANAHAVAINGWLGAVDVGSSNIPSALNPTGPSPVTVVSWFQTGPADAPGRFQEIIGHSDSSYRLSLGQTGGDLHFNPGPGPELQFTSPADVATNGFAFNDGQWHMIAGVSDGTNEYLYLDGALAKTNANATGINIAGSTRDLLLGGDPQYTFASVSSANTIRNFDGQIAHVGFWTNALSASQIQQLFNAAGMPPYSWKQLPSAVTINAGQNLNVASGIRGSSLQFQWYRNGSAVANQTNSSLTYSPITTNNAGSYYVIASSTSGSVTSLVMNITVYGVPTIVQQTPAQLNIFAGASPTLHVTANGATPISYQWNLNRTPITGATNSSFTLTNIQAGGTYTCTMTNIVGAGSMTPIVVTVLPDPSAPFPTQVLADGPSAYFRLDEASGTTAYDYVGGNNGAYTNATLGQPGYTSQNSVQSDPNETSVEFGDFPPNNDYAGYVPTYLNFGTSNGGNAEFSVEAWITQYFYLNGGDGIISIGYGGGGEQFVLDTGNGASGALRFFVRNAAGTVSAANSTNLLENDGLWHHVVGVCDEAGGHVYLYLDGVLVGSGNITAGSGLLSSTRPLTIGARESGDNGMTNYDYQFIGKIDDVAVYSKALSAAQVQSHYFGSGTAPQIAQVVPSNWTTNQAANVSFTVTALGTAPLTYQWTDNNGNLIPWATGATLSLTNVQPSQAGTYTVSVSNPYGGPVATNVNLMVTQAPQIITDITPSNATVYASTSLTLSVTASGTPPLHYQWYQDGAAILNATNTTYSFAAATGSHTYYVAITNIYSAGSPTLSSTATIVGMPITTLNPTNYTDHLKITFPGYNRSETLSDFPVLVRLSTNLPAFNYSHFASANGSDLRFADASGTREIPSEIDQWNPSGESTVWVQVPALSGTNTTIWAYWGNPSPDVAVPSTNVWIPQSWEGLPSYDLVYHLKEAGFPYADSAGQFPSLAGNAPSPVAGIVGTGELFSASFLDAGTINVGNFFTVSAWVNVATNASNIQGVWASKAGGNSSGFGLFINSYQTADGKLILETGNGAGPVPTVASAAGAVGVGQWHLVSAAIDRADSIANLYVDGALVAHGSGLSQVRNDFSTNNDIDLGQLTNGSFAFNGLIDEARIRSDVSSSNWVWASWMTVAQNSSLQGYSAISSTVTNPPVPVTINVQVSGGNLTLTGSGGSPGAPYYVIGSTNLALPVAQWTILSTNAFDGSGNFNVSVPINTAKPAQFIRIKQ